LIAQSYILLDWCELKLLMVQSYYVFTKHTCRSLLCSF